MVELVIEDAVMPSSKVAVMFAPGATSTAAFTGDDAVIVGGVVSGGGGAAIVNVQVASAASGLPAASVTPERPPSTVARYVVAGSRSALGSRVATRVTAS